MGRRRLIKQIPAYQVPAVNGTLSGVTVSNTNDILTVSGSGYANIRIQKDGSITTTHGTSVWFVIPAGCNLLFRLCDISYTNNTSTAVSLDAKWGITTSDSNFATASYNMPANTSGSDGEAEFFNAAYSTERIINSLSIQLTHNGSPGCTVQFRIELYINGVRYF